MMKEISESTPVKLGLIIALCSLFGSDIWWRSRISTQVEGIQTMLATVVAQREKVASDVDELKAWRKVVEQIGSPAVQKVESHVIELEKRFDARFTEIEKTLDRHVITTAPKPQAGEFYGDSFGRQAGGRQ